MDYSQFGYPKYELPLLSAYSGCFSAAFIALHPFFRMPTSEAWEPVDSSTNYPDDPYIRQYGQSVRWETVMRGIGCEDVRRFYIGMRTSIGALTQEYQDQEMSSLIRGYEQQSNIYYPMEGFVSPLLIEPIAQYISHQQTEEILYLREFETEPEVLPFEAVIQKSDKKWVRGSLFDAKVTRLATVDWDDFFTVIYGARDQLASWLNSNPLEGFFCNDQTLHGWCWQETPVTLSL